MITTKLKITNDKGAKEFNIQSESNEFFKKLTSTRNPNLMYFKTDKGLVIIGKKVIAKSIIELEQ